MTTVFVEPRTDRHFNARPVLQALSSKSRRTNGERTRTGELIIMTPIGGTSGAEEASHIANVAVWNERSQLGVVFSSQTVFNLPGGGSRAPDVAWVRLERW